MDLSRYTAFALIGLCTQFASAQVPQVSLSRLGVDSLKLVSGERLYGFVLVQHPNRDVELAVERNWLELTYPKITEKQVKYDGERTQRVYAQLIERTKRWIEDRPLDQSLNIFLTMELARFEALKSHPDAAKRFVRIVLRADTFTDLVKQPTDRRRIAGLAWQHGLESPTTTPVSILEKRLLDKGVVLSSAQVNLAAQVSPTEESERQWLARKALVEYQLRTSLEYQGTGTTLVRKTNSPDFGALIGQMLGGGGGLDAIGQLGAELGLPEFRQPQESSDWWKRVTAEAEREDFCGVLISRVIQSRLSPEVSVELSFLALEKPGLWFVAKQLRTTANASQQSVEQLQHIQEDPQIKTVLDTIETVGLTVDRSLIDQALRHGAATQQALQTAMGLFNEFLLQYTRELDGPAVPLLSSEL